MSRRLQDARTEAARWRSRFRRMGALAREMLLMPIGGHDDRPDQALSWRGLEAIPGSSPFAELEGQPADNGPLEAVRAQVVKARANCQEAVLYVLEDGVAREVGRVPPGVLQLQLDRKPRW